MKVPTYNSKLQIPRQGSGQFLTAQLSQSAMTAPATAFAQLGENIAAKGQQVSDFAFKKAQIGAENEALTAQANLGADLAGLQAKMLRSPNMQNAEKNFDKQSAILIEKHKAGLSNSLARNAFSRRAVQEQYKNKIQFTKLNNVRAVEARTVILNNDASDMLTFAADPRNSIAGRIAAASNGLDLIDSAAGDLGPKETESGERHF